MQIFDIKPITIKKSKVCSCCKKIFEVGEEMLYGHSNFKNITGECSSYICLQCASEMTGYVAECECWDFV